MTMKPKSGPMRVLLSAVAVFALMPNLASAEMTEAQKQAAEVAKKAAEIAAEAAKKGQNTPQPQTPQQPKAPQAPETVEMTEAQKQAAEVAKKAAENAAEAAKAAAKATATPTTTPTTQPGPKVFDVATKKGTGIVTFAGLAGHVPGQVYAVTVTGSFNHIPANQTTPFANPTLQAAFPPTTNELAKISRDTVVTLNGNPVSPNAIQVGDTVTIHTHAIGAGGISVAISR